MADPIKKEKFKNRALNWANRLEIVVQSISVRHMKTKWASCSSAGRMTFDESLPGLPVKLQDYVIVHELLHFRTPNHGKLWKSLMRAYLGEYEVYEADLKRLAGKERSV